MISTVTQQEAAAATKRILEFYREIPASSPKTFVAGLTALLSTYPKAVIARAVDPIGGIPAEIEFLNLARIKKLLDGWYDEHYQDVQRHQRVERRSLPEPPRDPEADARMMEKLRNLSQELSDGLTRAI